MSDGWLQQAARHLHAGEARQAEALAERALNGNDQDAPALQVLALALAMQDRRPEAIALLERVIALTPQDAQAHYNLAVSYQECGLVGQAMLAYRECLRRQPDHGDALWNYSDLLRLNQLFEPAVAGFQRLLALGLAYPGLRHRLAVALHGAGRDREAEAWFQAELADQPLHPALTQWEYAQLLLVQGRSAEGWAAYDHRFDAGIAVAQPYPYPRWQGEALHGKTLLVHGEQGLGDELMFASLLPELLAEGAQLILACQPPLQALLQHSFPEARVLPHRARHSPADIEGPVDYQIAIGSLPRYRRLHEADVQRQSPHLRADAERVAGFAAHLREHAADAGQRLKVGLAWGANPARDVDWGRRRSQQKSLPVSLLEALAPARPDALFVSLHNAEIAPEAAFAPALNLVDCHRELRDMADTAALIANLDLVISVDTSIAHLAAGLGKPVWIPLMQRADWRWLRDTDRSPWYPTARLFRQTRQGDWSAVVADLVRALAEHGR